MEDAYPQHRGQGLLRQGVPHVSFVRYNTVAVLVQPIKVSLTVGATVDVSVEK